MRQVGALPYRFGSDGNVEVLLITSRGTGRWIIPKGNPINGLKAHEAAAREAFEEAGIRGKAAKKSIGTFHHNKQRAGQSDVDAAVAVFPLLVSEQLEDWPECHERERRWLDPIAASHLTADEGLKRILQVFYLTVLA